MTTKLTLTLNNQVIHRAKRYAKKNGQSVSELVESYFRSLTDHTDNEDDGLTASVRSLMGSFKAPEGFDYKTDLKEEKLRKHGKGIY